MLVSWYLVRQVLWMALLCVLGFTSVLMAGNLLKDILGHCLAGRIHFLELLYLLGLLVPNVIPYALPMGLVCALLWVLGRLSADHEWVALKSLGLSPWRCFRPIGLFLVLCFILTLGFYDLFLPKVARAYRYTLRENLHADPLRFLEPGCFVRHFPGYVAYVGAKDDSVLQDLCFWALDAQGRVHARVCAQRGELCSRGPVGSEGVLRLELYDGYLERYDPKNPEAFFQKSPDLVFFKKLPLELPLAGQVAVASQAQQLRFMNLRELRAAWQQVQNVPAQAMAYQIQASQRGALAFSLLPLGLLAFGLGVSTRRRERSAGVVVALSLTLAYYVCLMGLSSLAAYPQWRPDLLLWIPNLVFMVFGVYWLRRV